MTPARRGVRTARRPRSVTQLGDGEGRAADGDRRRAGPRPRRAGRSTDSPIGSALIRRDRWYVERRRGGALVSRRAGLRPGAARGPGGGPAARPGGACRRQRRRPQPRLAAAPLRGRGLRRDRRRRRAGLPAQPALHRPGDVLRRRDPGRLARLQPRSGRRTRRGRSEAGSAVSDGYRADPLLPADLPPRAADLPDRGHGRCRSPAASRCAGSPTRPPRFVAVRRPRLGLGHGRVARRARRRRGRRPASAVEPAPPWPASAPSRRAWVARLRAGAARLAAAADRAPGRGRDPRHARRRPTAVAPIASPSPGSLRLAPLRRSLGRRCPPGRASLGGELWVAPDERSPAAPGRVRGPASSSSGAGRPAPQRRRAPPASRRRQRGESAAPAGARRGEVWRCGRDRLPAALREAERPDRAGRRGGGALPRRHRRLPLPAGGGEVGAAAPAGALRPSGRRRLLDLAGPARLPGRALRRRAGRTLADAATPTRGLAALPGRPRGAAAPSSAPTCPRSTSRSPWASAREGSACARFDRARRRVEELAGVGSAAADLRRRARGAGRGRAAHLRAPQRGARPAARLDARSCSGCFAARALPRRRRARARRRLGARRARLVGAGEGGRAMSRSEHDLWRCANAPMTEDPGEPPSLVVEAEEGTSYQAFLCAGSLAEEAEFPGAAELLFAPLEDAGFPVDAVLHARWIGNREALGPGAKAHPRRRARLPRAGRGRAAGPGWQAEEDRELAREYEAVLQSSAHPPMLRASISRRGRRRRPRRAGAPGRGAARALRRGRACTARAACSTALFFDHLPRTDGGSVADYVQQMTVEQFGATVPIASAAGRLARRHLHRPHPRPARARPVRYDPTEAPRTARPSAVLLAGTLGSGKTLAAQAIAYGAAAPRLAGRRLRPQARPQPGGRPRAGGRGRGARALGRSAATAASSTRSRSGCPSCARSWPPATCWSCCATRRPPGRTRSTAPSATRCGRGSAA